MRIKPGIASIAAAIAGIALSAVAAPQDRNESFVRCLLYTSPSPRDS